jgi:hypothetical protein
MGLSPDVLHKLLVTEDEDGPARPSGSNDTSIPVGSLEDVGGGAAVAEEDIQRFLALPSHPISLPTYIPRKRSSWIPYWRMMIHHPVDLKLYRRLPQPLYQSNPVYPITVDFDCDSCQISPLRTHRSGLWESWICSRCGQSLWRWFKKLGR